MDGRIIRSRQLGLGEDHDSGLTPAADCGPTVLAITATVTTYPTDAAAVYAMHPTEVDGEPIEGGAATYLDDTSATFYAYNAGDAIPDAGTRLLVHRVGGRWVFSFSEPPP